MRTKEIEGPNASRKEEMEKEVCEISFEQKQHSRLILKFPGSIVSLVELSPIHRKGHLWKHSPVLGRQWSHME